MKKILTVSVFLLITAFTYAQMSRDQQFQSQQRQQQQYNNSMQQMRQHDQQMRDMQRQQQNNARMRQQMNRTATHTQQPATQPKPHKKRGKKAEATTEKEEPKK